MSLFKGGEAKLSKTCLSVYINFLVIGEEGPSALDQSRQRCCLKHVPIMGTVRISFFFLTLPEMWFLIQALSLLPV